MQASTALAPMGSALAGPDRRAALRRAPARASVSVGGCAAARGGSRRRALAPSASSSSASPPAPPADAVGSPEDAARREDARRASQKVEERLLEVFDDASFDAAMEEAAAAHRLVVLEVQADSVCELGLAEEAEVQWKQEQSEIFAPCVTLRHSFQQAAADCPDVLFLRLIGDGSPAAQALAARLNVKKMPSVQFYRDGKMLWEHVGAVGAGADLGEGVLFFGSVAANGVRASEHIPDLKTLEAVQDFVRGAGEQLAVVNVALSRAAPCIHIYPAVLALARNMGGSVAFSRLIGDESAESMAAVKALNVTQVPTFIFYRHGAEVGRHVGSSKGDLIGQILQQQGVINGPPLAQLSPQRAPAPRVGRAPMPKSAGMW